VPFPTEQLFSSVLHIGLLNKGFWKKRTMETENSCFKDMDPTVTRELLQCVWETSQYTCIMDGKPGTILDEG
jgi:hypothetical protein